MNSTKRNIFTQFLTAPCYALYFAYIQPHVFLSTYRTFLPTLHISYSLIALTAYHLVFTRILYLSSVFTLLLYLSSSVREPYYSK